MKQYFLSSSTGDAYKRWGALRPTMPDMQELMNTVSELLDAGKYYTKDIYAGVIAQYSFNEEELARGKGVEGGVIGMEVYYARKRLEEQRLGAKEEQARQTLAPQPGKKLANIKIPGMKSVLRNVHIVEIGSVSGIMIEGTAGNRRKRYWTTCLAVEAAMKSASSPQT